MQNTNDAYKVEPPKAPDFSSLSSSIYADRKEPTPSFLSDLSKVSTVPRVEPPKRESYEKGFTIRQSKEAQSEHY